MPQLPPFPLAIWLILAATGVLAGVLTARSGLRGALAGLAAGLATCAAVALAAIYLVGRLEGGRAAGVAEILAGSVFATLRLLPAWLPMAALGVAAGAVVRRLRRRKPRQG